MKSSREQASKNRELVINAAGRLLRERGFDNVSVAEVMKAVDLTHGGFYCHFKSKSDLVALSCEQGIAGGTGFWKRLADERKRPLHDLVDHYLSVHHRDSPGSGCFYAALSSDVGRQEPSVKRVFTAGLAASLDVLTRVIGGDTKAAKRRRAMATIASLVGAMVLARAVDDEDLSQEILAATRSDLINR